MKIHKRFGRIWAAVLLAAVATGVGCGQEPTGGPTAEDLAKERAAAKKRAAQARKTQMKKQTVAKQPRPRPERTSPTELGVGSVVEGYSYDPTGKRDPFRSFMWERPDRIALEKTAGPLEKFDLNQLEVVAVVWRTGNARALVQDPSGETHIVGEGSAIGKNQGHVVAIADNAVVVKETYVDYLGQETTKDVEMRMRRNEGG